LQLLDFLLHVAAHVRLRSLQGIIVQHELVQFHWRLTFSEIVQKLFRALPFVLLEIADQFRSRKLVHREGRDANGRGVRG
jgi:hypothetical protein